MKKKQLCILVFLMIKNTLVNGVGPINVEEVFNSPTWPQKKEEFNRKLRTGEISLKDLRFMSSTIENADLSGMYFRGANFDNCKFINVDLSNADVTEISISTNIFDYVNLEGAILYYPLDESGKPILEESFRYETDTPKNLLIRYSNLRCEFKKNKELGLDIAADIVEKKILAFRKILILLSLKIENEDLKDLDLTLISLEKSKLENVNFENITLNNVSIRNSKINNCCFINSTIKRSNLCCNQITNNDFRGANLYGTSVGNSFLDKNLWEGACLKEFKFGNAILANNYIVPSIIGDAWIQCQNDHPNIKELLKWTEIEAPIKFVHSPVDQKNTLLNKEDEEDDFVMISNL